MDRKRVFAIMVLGVFLAASAGISQAGGYMHGSKGHEEGAGMEKQMKHQTGTPYSEREMESSEYGDAGTPAEYRGPVETGTIPDADESSGLQDTGVDPERWEQPTAE